MQNGVGVAGQDLLLIAGFRVPDMDQVILAAGHEDVGPPGVKGNGDDLAAVVLVSP